MSGTKTAPGPWRVADLDRRVIEDDKGNVVADVREWRDPENANLIAAAPALRDALEALLDHYAGKRGYSTPHHMAVAALAKARGEDRDA